MHKSINSIKSTDTELDGWFNSTPFYNLIIETILDGVDIVDEELNIIYMNPIFENVFGKDAKGKNVMKFTKMTNSNVINAL